MTSRRLLRRRYAAFAVLAMGLPSGGSLAAQEMELPVEIQMTMISRIFAFDRAFLDRVGSELVLGIAYQGRYRESLSALVAVQEAVAAPAFDIHGMQVRIVVIDLEVEPSLEDALRRGDVDLLYVAPLRSADLAGALRLSHTLGITTLSGVPAYAEEGAAVSLGRRAARPEIIINLASCRIAGVRFSARLLDLARIVEGGPDGL